MRLDTLHTAETPEGIALSLRPAGLFARGLAYLIDFAIRLGIFVGISITVGMLGKMGFGILLVAYFCLEWFYPVIFELTRAAATPGKRVMGLRVVMDSGLPVTPAASLTRNLLRAADFSLPSTARASCRCCGAATASGWVTWPPARWWCSATR